MTTYATLVSNIKQYMEDDGTEFSAAIDTFISLTEIKMSRDVKTPGFRRRATAPLTAGNPFVATPADLVILESLSLMNSGTGPTANNTTLLLKTDEFMTEFWPDRSATGIPKYFNYFDDETLYLAPTPSSALNVEISYKYRLAGLSSSNTTNWLTENAYDALLYGCLVEAGSFNRNDAMVQKYMALYVAAVQAINNEQSTRLSMDGFYQKTES